jgi:hypothetical protein
MKKIWLANQLTLIIILILLLSLLGCPGSDEGPLKDQCMFNITIAIIIFSGLAIILGLIYHCNKCNNLGHFVDLSIEYHQYPTHYQNMDNQQHYEYSPSVNTSRIDSLT